MSLYLNFSTVPAGRTECWRELGEELGLYEYSWPENGCDLANFVTMEDQDERPFDPRLAIPEVDKAITICEAMDPDELVVSDMDVVLSQLEQLKSCLTRAAENGLQAELCIG